MKNVALLFTLLTVASVGIAELSKPAFAKSTGWLRNEAFTSSVRKMVAKGQSPTRVKVRKFLGIPQYSANFSNRGGFSYRIEHHLTREQFVNRTRQLNNPGPGLDEKLCLAKYDHVTTRGRQYWIAFWVDPNARKFRCKKLPR